MKILSLQSAVAYGHVGNSAAMFPLQRLGFEVWPVDTVQFSNHPGHGGFGGQVHAPDHVRAVLDGLARLAVLDACDGVLTGYLGDAANGGAALAAVARVKAGNPRALYLCDPVMGDEGCGLYVRPGIPEFLQGPGLAAADIVTPNRFELELLSGRPVGSLAEAAEAARLLLTRGPKVVVVTSLADSDCLACLTVTAGGAWAVRTPRLPFDPPINGAGDTLAALFLAHCLRDRAAPEALSLAVSSLYCVLETTLALGRRELALTQAQQHLVQPSHLFPPSAIG